MLSNLLELLFSTKGRISRMQFWLKGVLLCIAIETLYILMLAASISVSGTTQQGQIILAFAGMIFIGPLVIMWPLSVILIKRIHDRNKSGWLVLALLLPSLYQLWVPFNNLFMWGGGDSTLVDVIGLLVGVWFFIEFGCVRGTIGPNRYGPDPVTNAG